MSQLHDKLQADNLLKMANFYLPLWMCVFFSWFVKKVTKIEEKQVYKDNCVVYRSLLILPVNNFFFNIYLFFTLNCTFTYCNQANKLSIVFSGNYFLAVMFTIVLLFQNMAYKCIDIII